MRIDQHDAWLRGHVMTRSAPAAGSSTNEATPRGGLLRSLVRAHQRLVEERSRLKGMGAPSEPQIERDLAAIAERITDLLSNSEEENRDPAAVGRKEGAALRVLAEGAAVKEQPGSKTSGATRPGAWLSRRDWRRALDLFLSGRISRSEFERMKERLTRVRDGTTGRTRPQARLRLVPGGPPSNAVSRAGDLAATPNGDPREAA